MKPFQQTFMTRGYYDQYFDEDFVEGAVASMRLSIRRIQWRRSSGHWPSELIGANRTKMEAEIEQLVKAELERHSRGEITPEERTGPVVHRRRRGQMRMTPKKG